MLQEYLSAFIQLVAGFGFAGLIIVLSVIFGRRARLQPAQDVPYECGNVPEGEGAPAFFSIKYYIVAILFLVFDLEVVFLYPWALGFKEFVMDNCSKSIFVRCYDCFHCRVDDCLSVCSGQGCYRMAPQPCSSPLNRLTVN